MFSFYRFLMVFMNFGNGFVKKMRQANKRKNRSETKKSEKLHTKDKI
jgi:hypothetical protein